MRDFIAHDEGVQSCCFSSDGKKALSASLDKNVIVWDVSTAGQLYVLKGHEEFVWSCCFSPDDKKALSASYDRRLILWDVDDSPDGRGEQLKEFTGHTSHVLSCCFSPGGATVLSASRDKSVVLWDVESGRRLRTFVGHTNSVYSCCFSPYGDRVMSAASDIRIWSTAPQATVVATTGSTFVGHREPHTSTPPRPELLDEEKSSERQPAMLVVRSAPAADQPWYVPPYVYSNVWRDAAVHCVHATSAQPKTVLELLRSRKWDAVVIVAPFAANAALGLESDVGSRVDVPAQDWLPLRAALLVVCGPNASSVGRHALVPAKSQIAVFDPLGVDELDSPTLGGRAEPASFEYDLTSSTAAASSTEMHSRLMESTTGRVSSTGAAMSSTAARATSTASEVDMVQEESGGAAASGGGAAESSDTSEVQDRLVAMLTVMESFFEHVGDYVRRRISWYGLQCALGKGCNADRMDLRPRDCHKYFVEGAAQPLRFEGDLPHAMGSSSTTAPPNMGIPLRLVSDAVRRMACQPGIASWVASVVKSLSGARRPQAVICSLPEQQRRAVAVGVALWLFERSRVRWVEALENRGGKSAAEDFERIIGRLEEAKWGVALLLEFDVRALRAVQKRVALLPSHVVLVVTSSAGPDDVRGELESVRPTPLPAIGWRPGELRRFLSAGALQPNYLCKVVVVGDEGVGKTVMVSAFRKDRSTHYPPSSEGVTIDPQPLQLLKCRLRGDSLGCRLRRPGEGSDVNLSVQTDIDESCVRLLPEDAPLDLVFYDFAGQSTYHSTHQLFHCTKGAIYLVCLDLSVASEAAGHPSAAYSTGTALEQLRFWLRETPAPAEAGADAPHVIIVGTKADAVRERGDYDDIARRLHVATEFEGSPAWLAHRPSVREFCTLAQQCGISPEDVVSLVMEFPRVVNFVGVAARPPAPSARRGSAVGGAGSGIQAGFGMAALRTAVVKTALRRDNRWMGYGIPKRYAQLRELLHQAKTALRTPVNDEHRVAYVIERIEGGEVGDFDVNPMRHRSFPPVLTFAADSHDATSCRDSDSPSLSDVFPTTVLSHILRKCGLHTHEAAVAALHFLDAVGDILWVTDSPAPLGLVLARHVFLSPVWLVEMTRALINHKQEVFVSLRLKGIDMADVDDVADYLREAVAAALRDDTQQLSDSRVQADDVRIGYVEELRDSGCDAHMVARVPLLHVRAVMRWLKATQQRRLTGPQSFGARVRDLLDMDSIKSVSIVGEPWCQTLTVGRDGGVGVSQALVPLQTLFDTAAWRRYSAMATHSQSSLQRALLQLLIDARLVAPVPSTSPLLRHAAREDGEDLLFVPARLSCVAEPLTWVGQYTAYSSCSALFLLFIPDEASPLPATTFIQLVVAIMQREEADTFGSEVSGIDCSDAAMKIDLDGGAGRLVVRMLSERRVSLSVHTRAGARVRTATWQRVVSVLRSSISRAAEPLRLRQPFTTACNDSYGGEAGDEMRGGSGEYKEGMDSDNAYVADDFDATSHVVELQLAIVCPNCYDTERNGESKPRWWINRYCCNSRPHRHTHENRTRASFVACGRKSVCGWAPTEAATWLTDADTAVAGASDEWEGSLWGPDGAHAELRGVGDGGADDGRLNKYKLMRIVTDVLEGPIRNMVHMAAREFYAKLQEKHEMVCKALLDLCETHVKIRRVESELKEKPTPHRSTSLRETLTELKAMEALLRDSVPCGRLASELKRKLLIVVGRAPMERRRLEPEIKELEEKRKTVRASDCTLCTRLQKLHKFGKPQWSNSNPHEWPSRGHGWFEVCKLYVSFGKEVVEMEPAHMDAASCITMVELCNSDAFDHLRDGEVFSALRSVREVRRKYSHLSSGWFTAERYRDYLKVLRAALPALTAGDQSALAELQQRVSDIAGDAVS